MITHWRGLLELLSPFLRGPPPKYPLLWRFYITEDVVYRGCYVILASRVYVEVYVLSCDRVYCVKT